MSYKQNAEVYQLSDKHIDNEAALNSVQPTSTYRYELSCILNMENDAMWMHMANDNRPPFWNIFPWRSKKLIVLKNTFESGYSLSEKIFNEEFSDEDHIVN